jgi:GT2 family glycosyltransferase
VQWRRPAAFADDLRALLRGSDLVLAASAPLARAAARAGARTVLTVANGVDAAHFSQPTLPPESVRGLAHPVVGYVGFITDWFDVEMLAEAARRRPGWTFALAGAVLDADVDALRALPNVVLLGEQPYHRLPAFAQAFDVCCIPHRPRPRTHRAGSVKLFEYLSLGKPVVASPLEWLRPYQRRGLVTIARDGAAFVEAAERLLRRDGAAVRERRRAFAARHSWQQRYRALWPRVAPLFPRASVIVITFDNLACTRACLESVLACTALPGYEIVVVDNGSTDGTVAYLERLRRAVPGVRVLRHRRNEGFARAVNRGLRAARGDTLVLLNNDTVVTPGWLGGLTAHLLDVRVGAVGPTTNHAGNEAQIEVSYQTLDGLTAFAGRYAASHAVESLTVDRLSMFCFAMSRAVYEEVGPLDERFVLGMFEDDDYARRIRLTGRELRCVADVFVHHVGHAGFRRLGEGAYERLFAENRRRFEEKWGTAWVQAAGRPRSPGTGA